MSELGFTTSPEPIQGTNYYKITQAEVEGLKPQQMFSAAGGDFYILPIREKPLFYQDIW